MCLVPCVQLPGCVSARIRRTVHEDVAGQLRHRGCCAGAGDVTRRADLHGRHNGATQTTASRFQCQQTTCRTAATEACQEQQRPMLVFSKIYVLMRSSAVICRVS